jgi:hypothetical protein
VSKFLLSLSDRYHTSVDVFADEGVKRERMTALVRMMRPLDGGHPLVRVGGAHDGGYLIPDDFEGIDYCFSPGVSQNASFERDCLDRNIKSFLADYSVDGPPEHLPGCQFTKKYLGARDTKTTMTLDRWVDESVGRDFAGDLLLQMDIEGHEFETLLAARQDTLSKFRIAVIEIHHSQRLRRRSAYRLWSACLERLKTTFDVVHVHPNNCSGVVEVHGFPFPRVFEITLHRKDRVLSRRPIASLPHPLDQRNQPDKPDLALPPAWLEID